MKQASARKHTLSDGAPTLLYASNSITYAMINSFNEVKRVASWAVVVVVEEGRRPRHNAVRRCFPLVRKLRRVMQHIAALVFAQS